MVKEPSNFSNPIILCSVLPLVNSIELIRVSIVLSVVLFEPSIVLSIVLGAMLGETWSVDSRWLSGFSFCLDDT